MTGFRISHILMLFVAGFCAISLFWTSQSVQVKERDLKKMQKELAREKDALRVLTLEWDYLNRPERLEKLAHEQLGMVLPKNGIVRSVDDIPEPAVVDIDPSQLDEGTGMVEAMPASLAIPSVQAQIKASVQTAPSNVVSPSQAEKQSFDRLLEKLDDEEGATP